MDKQNNTNTTTTNNTFDNNQKDIKIKILLLIQNKDYSSLDLSKEINLSHQETVGLLKSLEAAEKITLKETVFKQYSFTNEGIDVLDKGSPEIIYINYLKSNPNGEALKSQISNHLNKTVDTRGFSNAMKLKAIKFDKSTNKVFLTDINKEYLDINKQLLLKVKNNNYKIDDSILSKQESNLLIKEKYLLITTTNYFIIGKGLQFSLDLNKLQTDLTKELLIADEYKNKKFKKYNYNAKGLEVDNGSLHPLLRVRSQFREIMLELGFEEMPTNNYVESSFWNFDTLFQPQQHPARDAHDTFFLTNPSKSSKLNNNNYQYKEYFNKVINVHEKGGYGSIGWRYNFSEEETLKNILRTHTTAVSSRMLFKLAQDFKNNNIFTPKKYFSIDRVFRNETLDNTHLCEFHQIEGVIIDYNLGLNHLISIIEMFFKKFGIEKLRFKPAYNPYTEPSMEIFSYHKGMKKWVEIGNSGIFRPEMLAPMGLPKDVTAIAWGLSLERPTMIYYGLNSIKDLFGDEVQLKDTKNSSIYCINL